MIIYGYVYIIMVLIGIGYLVTKGAYNVLYRALFTELLILPFLGRVLGWW